MNTKVLRRMVIQLAAGLVGFAALLALGVIVPRQWSFPKGDDCEFTVYVASDGFHTNFFVPVSTSAFNWRDRLDLDKVADRASQDYRYLQFGWGDRIFYVETPSWDQVKPSNALRALFYWRNDAALFVKGHATLPQSATEEVKCLRLNRSDYLALMDFIDRSFELNGGQKQRIASGQDHQSSFYAANGSYSILNTCNSWTADGLRAANVNTPLWAGLAQPVMYHLRNGCECEEEG